MQNRKIYLAIAMALLTVLTGWYLSGCNPSEKNPVSHLNGNDSVYKIIKAAQIQAALDKSPGKKIILNIYPVKLSNDSNRNDLSLKFFFQDAGGAHTNLDSGVNNENFEMQSAWYFSHLKRKNIPRNNIPYGYYVEIDTSFMKGATAISFRLLADLGQMQFYTLSKKSDDPKNLALKDDSTCKCPPECCDYNTLRSDSAGKCPPCLLSSALLFANSMEQIINKEYDQK